MVQASRPAISVVMIVGTNRDNAQGVLDALGRQSCADDLLEIVVQDLVAVMAFLFCKIRSAPETKRAWQSMAAISPPQY